MDDSLSCAAARPCAICRAQSSAFFVETFAPAQGRAQRLAFEKLHDENGDEKEEPGISSNEWMDATIRVIQRGEQLRFPLEPLSPLFTFKELFRQDLDRDISREARVLRLVDLPHPSRADLAEDLVRAELRAGGERHRRGSSRFSRSRVQWTSRLSGGEPCSSGTVLTRNFWWSPVAS